jgi:uncharacterized membrane protein
MPSLIDAYLADFDRALGFDRRLAQRVHQEVEAHLHEAMDDAASEAEAIRRFGNPQALAQAYAEATLPSRLRKTRAVALAVAVATFLFMRLRSVGLALPEIDNGPFAALTAIDRTGFVAGILFSLYAWHVSRRGAQTMLPPLLGATAAFLLSVIASLMRASILFGDDPLIWWTGAAEILTIAAASLQIRLLQRHAAVASG